jgi:hypothetical protein
MNVAKMILEQLGGHRFVAMTGAKNLLACDDGQTLQFHLPRGAKDGCNAVRITLAEDDTYTVRFFRVGRDYRLTDLAEVTMVYADSLRRVFTAHTGLDTSL